MASVKWLRSITAIAEPFEGVQQTLLYRYRRSEDEPGTPVTRKQPRALMAPPGIPEFLSRVRHVPAGRTRIEGRAWSGGNAVERVEFSADGGRTWEDARLGAVQRQARLDGRGRTSGSPPAPATTSSASARPTPPATPSPSTAPRPGIAAATASTRSSALPCVRVTTTSPD